MPTKPRRPLAQNSAPGGPRRYAARAGLYRRFGLLELTVVELRIEPAPGKKLLVCSLLDNVAVVHHEDEVGIADRRQAVGDDEARPPLHEVVHRLLDQDLSVGVH